MSEPVTPNPPLPADKAVLLSWAIASTEFITNHINGPEVKYLKGTKFVIPKGQCPRQTRDVGALKGLDSQGRIVWLGLRNIEEPPAPDPLPAPARTPEVAVVA
jgi:hypothetical protein